MAEYNQTLACLQTLLYMYIIGGACNYWEKVITKPNALMENP